MAVKDWRIGSRVIVSDSELNRLMMKSLMEDHEVEILPRLGKGLGYKIIEQRDAGLVAEIVEMPKAIV